MQAKRLKLALFDCDGTLVDSQHAIVAAMTAAWRALGLADPDPLAVRRIVGLSLVDAIARLLPEAAPATCEDLAEAYRQAFFEFRRRGAHPEPLFPGIGAALDALEQAGVLLGIATGKSRRGLDAILERHGLLRRFVTLQTADTAPSKPNPAMVLRAAAETGVPAGDIVVIGDTVFDILMARAARARSVGVAWGYHDADELRQAGADRLVETCAAVPGTVLSLMEG